MARNYGDGTNSHIGSQLRTELYQRKALIEQKKTQFFGQLGDTTQLPKNSGKAIKRFLYLPMLDDRNNTDQGIDATGSSARLKQTIQVRLPSANGAVAANSTSEKMSLFFTAETTLANINDSVATQTTALLILCRAQVVAWSYLATDLGGGGLTQATVEAAGNAAAQYTLVTTTNGESAFDLGYRFTEFTAVPYTGNLYGSSKDVGTITGKLPALGENGGRVNRVGFKRVELEGTINKFGFFDEYSADSLQFDSDKELSMHVNREMLRGAGEITEDMLQLDLLNAAGVVRFGGDAVSNATVTGEAGASASVMTFKDLQQLDIDLTNNLTPKHTTIQTGSRNIDTRTIPAARYMYIGSELQPMFENMVDQFNRPAFIPVEQYAGKTTLAVGEIGIVGKFRLILVPEMMHWSAEGAAITNNDGYRSANGENYDVFPTLVVGDQSFQTIGFGGSGKTAKFTIYHKKPGLDTVDKTDPYGEQGLMSIKWWYGFMVLRPERIAVTKSVAEW